MSRSRLLGGCAALVVGSCLAVAPAGAETASFPDRAGDVRMSESDRAVTEPAVDVLSLEVEHTTRELAVTIEVAEVVPAGDERWEEGYFAQVVLAPADADGAGFFEGPIWFWDLVAVDEPAGYLVRIDDDEFVECETEASIDEESSTYSLAVTGECLQGVPRLVRAGAVMTFDDDVDDDDYDVAYDAVPDGDDLTRPVGSAGAPELRRLAGETRIGTAIALSKDRYAIGDADTAVIVGSSSVGDAASGATLAASLGAPLLLTNGSSLEESVRVELERALPIGAPVHLVGGSGVLREELVGQLRALGYKPRRHAGADRFETAVAVADELDDRTMVLIVDARSTRASVIAAAAAASLDAAVVLSDGPRLPKTTSDFLAHEASRHVAIGTAASAASPGAERITGADAAQLSARVIDRLLPDVSALAVAGQATGADGFAGAAHLASLGGGLLVTDGDALSADVRAELEQRSTLVREVLVYGGTGSVGTAVFDQIAAAVS